jgi:hypothetical protein
MVGPPDIVQPTFVVNNFLISSKQKREKAGFQVGERKKFKPLTTDFRER